jgi:hypothetical protein
MSNKMKFESYLGAVRARRGAGLPMSTLLAGLLLSVAGAGAAVAEPAEQSKLAAADPIAALQPGQWYEVPDSHLEAVAAPQAKFPWLSGGIGGITSCWAGGAFDAQRDRLYLGPGGGHAGYNGNEIYAFDLNDLKWHRLNDPDPVLPGTEYTDLNVAPFAMHTYDGVEYLPPPVDRYVVVGGWGTPRTYALNPDRPERWEVYADHGTGRTGDICAYDPLAGLLWLSTPTTAGKLSQWDPLSHQWTLRLSSSPNPSYYETADVDFKRRLFVACGRGKVKTWKLAPAPAAIVFEEIKTTGDAEVIDRASPGFCYAPLIDKFVAWANGPDVYTLDMDTKKWTRHPPAANNPVTPGPADQWGTFGRFRYVPSRNVFVLYNATNQNVFVYRLTADRPNVITGVAAKVVKSQVESDIPTAAISVEALYADGTRKNVTDEASYFSLDSAVAQADVHGRGMITGISAGKARLRVVYSDPAYKRGYADEVAVGVKDILGEATLDSIQASFHKLTLPAGDSYALEVTGSYRRGSDRFSRRLTDQTKWTSADPAAVSVGQGVVKGIRSGGPIVVTAACHGKTDSVEVTVTDAPVIKRINFQVSDAPPRAGWLAENGQTFSAARGFGWLSAGNYSLRDDRAGTSNPLLKSFVSAEKQQQFKVDVPSGAYTVRIAMGDADYGAVPFERWTALGDEKLIYYQGHANNHVTRIVRANDDGLLFTVNGPINYLILAPVGVDLDKYADDGSAAGEKK